MTIGKITFKSDEIEEMVRNNLLPLLDKYRIFTFSGPLGAGKTTVIKEFLRQAGVTEVVSSPTFTYVKRYSADDGKIFNHFDLYRITSENSFLDQGFDEYLYEDFAWSFIEWPGIINQLLQRSSISSHVWNIELSYVEGDLESRQIQMASFR